MINFLHTNIPNAIFFQIGPLTIHKYGLLMVCGMLLGIFLSIKLASYYNISKNIIVDSAFNLLFGGIIGARIYHVFLELPYYIAHPIDIFKIWNGGLAIHGAIIAGILITWHFTRKNNINLWTLLSIYAPALMLAQAIGRWGNYFNQELFGLPTNKPWGIPISSENRVSGFENFEYFHPTFLYESFGNFTIFIILIFLHFLIIKKIKKIKPLFIVLIYGFLYSILRFSLEFIRIDNTPELFSLRWPQIASILMVIFLISIGII